MSKILVVLIHPNMKESVMNRRWVEELEKMPNKVTVHDLYANYPDAIIDVKREQELMEQHDKIIFQFPFYWFNCPPLYKQWLDEVLTYGWAYGRKSNYKLSGKKIYLAVSIGIDEQGYSTAGKYKHTMEEFLIPFKATFEYIRADYQKPFLFYGLERNSTDEWINKGVKDYLDFIENI